MAESKRAPSPDLDTLMPLLLAQWRRFRKEPGPPDRLQTREFRSTVAAIHKLQKGQSGDYFADPELLSAYLLYPWVVHYQQGLSLINELPTTPRRVLDLCSGGLPFALAALRHGAHEVTAVDQNLTALQLGAEVCGRYGYAVNLRQWNCLKGPCPVSGPFDLIIMAHCLEELFPSSSAGWRERQDAFIDNLLSTLSPEGYLLIVDSSLVEMNHRILALRDRLVEQGVPVQAPCVWRGECPALKTKDSPCYAQREFEKPFLIKELQRACNINLGSLKMSYIIFRSPQAQWPALPQTPPHYRVISPPIESYQGKRYFLCGTDGKRSLGSHLRQHPAESRAFEFLKRGELISIEDALQKGNSLDIVEGTRVSVKAACNKPII